MGKSALREVWKGTSFLPQPVSVDSIAVRRAPLIETVAAEGKTRIRDIFVLSAPVAGRLLRIESEVGDEVSAGETEIARIEPSDPSYGAQPRARPFREGERVATLPR